MVTHTFLISVNILTMPQCQLQALEMGCWAQGPSPAQAWPTSSMGLGLPSLPLQPPPLPGPSLPAPRPGATHIDELTSSQAPGVLSKHHCLLLSHRGSRGEGRALTPHYSSLKGIAGQPQTAIESESRS